MHSFKSREENVPCLCLKNQIQRNTASNYSVSKFHAKRKNERSSQVQYLKNQKTKLFEKKYFSYV